MITPWRCVMAKIRRPVMAAAAAGAAGGAVLTAMLGAGLASDTRDLDRTSYAIGFDLGSATVGRLEADGVSYDAESLRQGFVDAMDGAEPAFEQRDMTAALAVLHRQVAQRSAEARLMNDPVFEALARQNESRSEAFLERFAEAEGTRKLDNGMHYQVQSAGDGATPEAGDTVRISFSARLRDGVLVGDERNFVMPLEGMIPGARSAIASMSVGDRWIVAIPPELAFGLGGRDPDIGPNEAILADIELLGIEP
jgi:FKBP-type peptidyl-prolyl cis-trans isomerase FklB